ncbi:zinc knuckle CX2CX4HX4C containing protein [Tanacetum coccineum]
MRETLIRPISIGLSKVTMLAIGLRWLGILLMSFMKGMRFLVEFMVREVLDIEIKDALFSMGDDKAPRPDGFTAAFFKKSWDIVGGEITNAVSNIIANRIKEDLGDLVSINQSAFVSGRRISDNILLMQELMRNYHRKRGPPRCAFKVYIQKAYGTVDWGFLRSILVGFVFHPTMVEWIMVYISTTSYSVCINEDMYGWFNGKRGLRQDDLFLFARSLTNSVRVIINALEEFKNVSGLIPSIPKSTAFFCNVPNALKASILCSMPFAEGTLPVKYLGVPLISSRLLYRDFKVLVEKLESRLIRGFLWCQGEMKKGKAKVAWEAVCLPYREGELGIRILDDYNVALMTTHINNGRSTSMWFDRWVDSFPLHDMLTVRNIVYFGFSLSNTVIDLISNGSWRWPYDWLARFPNVVNILLSNINNELDDVIVWHDVQGVFHRFSVARAWDSLWLRADVVDWYHVVHVFTGMYSIPPRLVDVLVFLIPSKGSSASNVISWIVLAATNYCLWNEHKSRLFKNKKSTADQIIQLITSLVWMKLVTFKFKKVTTGSRLLLDQWKIPSSCFYHDRCSR